MVSRNGGCFACSQCIVKVITVLMAISGILWVFVSFGITPEIEDQLCAKLPSLLFIMGMVYIGIGMFGLFSAYSLKYWAVLTFAILSIFWLFFNVFVGIYSTDNLVKRVVYGLVNLFGSMPLVICSWVIFAGIHSEPTLNSKLSQELFN